MLQLSRNGLRLQSLTSLDESQGSSNVKVSIQNDGTYTNYSTQLHYGYYVHDFLYTKGIAQYENGVFILPREAFKQYGLLNLSVLLVSSDEELMTNQVQFIVKAAPRGDMVIDDIPSAQQQVLQLVQTTLDQYAHTINLNKNEIAVLKSRMDSFTSLQQGSTTGDAELIDGRVGYDGKTYENIGGAIRGQVSQLSDDIDYFNKFKINVLKIFKFNINKYYDNNVGVSTINDILSSSSGNNSFGVYECSNGDEYRINKQSNVYLYSGDGVLRKFISNTISFVCTTSDYEIAYFSIVAPYAYNELICYNIPNNIETEFIELYENIAKSNGTNFSNDYAIQTFILKSLNVLQTYNEQITINNYSTRLSDFNFAKINKIYALLGSVGKILNSPNTIQTNGTLISINPQISRETDVNKSFTIQLLICPENELYIRSCWFYNWTEWKNIASQYDVDDLKNKIDKIKNGSLIPSLNQKYFSTTCVNKLLSKIDNNTKAIFFGDSITAGGSYGKSWSYYLSQLTGCNAINKAVAGSLFCETIDVKPSNFWLRTQIENVTEDEWEETTVVFIACGTNDIGYNSPLQEVKDKVIECIELIKSKSTAHIIFITPINRGNIMDNDSILKIPELSGIITQQALIKTCSVIRGLDFPIPPYNEGLIDNLQEDYIHPFDTGMYIYARCVLNETN